MRFFASFSTFSTRQTSILLVSLLFEIWPILLFWCSTVRVQHLKHILVKFFLGTLLKAKAKFSGKYSSVLIWQKYSKKIFLSHFGMSFYQCDPCRRLHPLHHRSTQHSLIYSEGDSTNSAVGCNFWIFFDIGNFRQIATFALYVSILRIFKILPYSFL